MYSLKLHHDHVNLTLTLRGATEISEIYGSNDPHQWLFVATHSNDSVREKDKEKNNLFLTKAINKERVRMHASPHVRFHVPCSSCKTWSLQPVLANTQRNSFTKFIMYHYLSIHTRSLVNRNLCASCGSIAQWNKNRMIGTISYFSNGQLCV